MNLLLYGLYVASRAYVVHVTHTTGENLTPIQSACVSSWTQACNATRVIIWTDKSIPDVLKQCDIECPRCSGIQLSDLCRLCVLYLYGGVYADTDVQCFSRFDTRLRPDVLYIYEGPSKIDNGIQNALIVSRKRKHPLLLTLLQSAKSWTWVWPISHSLDWSILKASSVATAGNPWIRAVLGKSPGNMRLLPYEKYSCQKSADAIPAYRKMLCNSSKTIKYAVHHNQKSWV